MSLIKIKNRVMTLNTSQSSLKASFVKLLFLKLAIVAISFMAHPLSGQKIIHEKAGDAYSVYKAEANNKEVIFRADRIEILDMSKVDEKRTFLKFKNLQPSKIRLEGEIRTYKSKLENEGMAQVLGLSELSITEYERLVYENVYEDIDLVVTIIDGDVDFKFSNLIADSKSQLQFDIVGDDLFYKEDRRGIDLSQGGKSLATIKSNQFEIQSGVLSVDHNAATIGSSVLQISFQ